MSIRLNNVTRDLNVGIQTAVEFLQKKGYTIESNPNAKITDEQYAVLVKAFSSDKNLKEKSDVILQQRKEKKVMTDEPKPMAEVKTEIPQDARPKFKVVGSINLGNVGPKDSGPKKVVTPQVSAPAEAQAKPKAAMENPAAKMPAQDDIVGPEAGKNMSKQQVGSAKPETKSPAMADEKKVVASAEKKHTEPHTAHKGESTIVKDSTTSQHDNTIVAEKATKMSVDVKEKMEEKKPEEKTPNIQPTLTQEKKEAPQTAAKEGIFELRPTELKTKINVVGQIDLAALNQSTRPKKKTKEELKKERDDKEKQRAKQRQQMKEAIMKEISKTDNGSQNKSQANAGGENNAHANNDQGRAKKRNRINRERVDIAAESQNSFVSKNPQGGRGNNQQGKKNDKYNKKFTPKAEVNDDDVAKQVKETLARLTNKQKSKASKYRKEKRENVQNRLMEQEEMQQEESKILKITEFVTANELASMMNINVTQVIATCMSVGIMVSINQRLDAETINLVAEEFGYETEYVSAEVAQAITEDADDEADLKPRAPIVTVMGHVDHGKTSLLDYIRKTNVIAGEAGGITQHIGAYNVSLEDGRHITFLDTPGHEAFTAMRARGAKVTDIVIVIVAADDNVMPQTKEAINHAMAAGVPIVFAINKIDKPAANPEKIKEELAAMNFLVEEWGGKYQSQDISAKKGLGVPELMEKVLLEAEMLDLKANPNRKATGSIIDSSLDKGRGYVATILVSNGTLKMGDIVLAGTSYGKVKAMFNERGQRLKQAGPSEPVLILGLNGAPAAGDTFHVIDTDQEAREIANKREQLQREQGLRTQKRFTLDELGRRLALGDFHELNIIVKGDVDGSVEALSDSLIKLTTERIQINVIHKAVGQISESDVTLAAASNAIIVGFQVRPSGAAAKLAEQEGVDIRNYSVIYDALEEVKAAMEGLLAPTKKEQVTATIEVREVFHISKVGDVAGAMVKTGKVKRSDKARLIRDGIVVYSGNINALKRFKDDVKEVLTNFECGISLTNCNDLKVGDVIETYEEIEVKATL